MNRLIVLLTAIFIINPAFSFGIEPDIDSFKNYIQYRLGSNILLLDPELAGNAKITFEAGLKERIISSVSFSFKKGTLSVSFDPGPSEDPMFVINYNDIKKRIGGEKLYISSNGSLYLVKLSNEYFEKRLKYIISEEGIKEVRQPFYRVDQECKTSTPLKMYQNKCNRGELIASLPKGSTVHILVIENVENDCPSSIVPDNEIGDPVNNFMVSTPFGLVGWVVSSGGYLHFRPGKPLGCIRFMGD